MNRRILIGFLVVCILHYHMASSASGQDESNPALWLATRLLDYYWTTRRVLQEIFPWKPYSKFFIDQACFGQDGWILASLIFCVFNLT